MKCPYCGHPDTRVIDSPPADDGNSIRRRRSCDVCGKRFTTYEKVETIPLIIIKKDNNREQYNRGKIENGRPAGHAIRGRPPRRRFRSASTGSRRRSSAWRRRRSPAAP